MNSQELWQSSRASILSQFIISPELWQAVESYAEELLVQGRPNFDLPHTRAVVHWAYVLGVAHNVEVTQSDREDDLVDLPVLLTAAWLHDIGYFGQFEQVASLSEVTDKKALHMLVGAQMARQFLENHATKWLNADQIDQVVLLVSMHDALDKIETILVTLLMEADTIGMMDVDRVQPTYTGLEALQFPDQPKTQERVRLFRTELGKKVIENIILGFKLYVMERDFDGLDERKKS